MNFFRSLLQTFGLTLLIAVAGSLSFAGRKPPKPVGNGIDPCLSLLDPKDYPAGRIQVKLSGREGHESEALVQSAEEIFGENGIFQRLGYRLPHQQIIMQTPADLIAALSGPGLYPLPHWKVGLDIINGRSKAGVYEVVNDATSPTRHHHESGECQGCRSLYKDSSLLNEQRSIFGHVAGHNDFNAHNPLARLRPSDQVASSVRLGEVMWEAMQDPYIGFDRVQLFYQFLSSMISRQDYFTGSHLPPEKLSIEGWLREREKRAAVKFGASRDAVLTVGRKVDIPHKTFQGLASFVANMPPHTPRWKREMAQHFEAIVRSYPGVGISKSQNEGWATFSQFLFIKHSPWQEPVTLEEYASLMFKVTGSELYHGAENLISNPYWIGLSAWMHLYERFENHPENSKEKLLQSEEYGKLFEAEKKVAIAKGRPEPTRDSVHRLLLDRRFVDFAHEVMQRYPSDSAFFRYALTNEWFEKYEFFLYNQADIWEIPWNERRKAPSPEHIPTTVTSVRPERIREAMVRGLFDHRSGMPMVRLGTMNFRGRRVVGYEHEAYDEIALSAESVGKTLFVYTQLHETTTSLETFFNELQGFKPWGKLANGSYGEVPSKLEWVLDWRTQKPSPRFGKYREINGEWVYVADPMYLTPMKMRVEVDPDGTVRVYRQFEEIELEEVQGDDWKTYGAGDKPKPREKKKVVEVLDSEAAELFKVHIENYQADLALGHPGNPLAQAAQNKLDAEFSAVFGPDLSGLLTQTARRAERHVMGGAVVSRSLGNRFQEAALDAFEKVIGRRMRAAIQLFMLGKVSGQIDGKSVKISVMPQIPDFAFDREVQLARRFSHPLPPVDESFFANLRAEKISLAEQGRTQIGPGSLYRNESGIGRGKVNPGDTWWKPPPKGGEDPAKGRDGDHIDPTVVEVPYEIFRDLLNQAFILPNGRKLKGKNDEFELVRSGTRPNPNGEVVWTDTVNNYLGKGLAMTYAEYRKERSKQYQADVAKAKKEGTYLDEKGKPTIDQKDYLFTLSDFRREMRKPGSQMTKRLLKQGAIYSTESDIVTEHQDEIPTPTRRILVIYARDMSGSMQGLGEEVSRQTVANVSQMAHANYDHVEERFIGFDTEAYEFSREEFFGVSMGGGNLYHKGYELAEEIIREYDTKNIDIYVICVGDSGTWNEDLPLSKAAVRRLADVTRYQAYVEIGNWFMGDIDPSMDFGGMMKGLQEELPWFGFGAVRDKERSSLMEAMHEIFGPHRAKPHGRKE